VKRRWHSWPPLRRDSGFGSALRNPARTEATMDLRFLSRNAESAKRSRHLLRRRGVTFTGAKIWERSEDDVLRTTVELTVSEVQKRLPHRTANAIERRREKLGLVRRKLGPRWKTVFFTQTLSEWTIEQSQVFCLAGASTRYKAALGISASAKNICHYQKPRDCRFMMMFARGLTKMD
jgi:hypothetical protein